jgi:hypothetical protein
MGCGSGNLPLPSVLGETIKVNDVPLTIVGVNPKGFTGAKDVQLSPELFIPLTMQPLVQPRHGSLSYEFPGAVVGEH